MTTISPSRRRTPPAAAALLLLLVVLLVVAAALWRAQLGGLFWRVGAPLVALRNAFDQSENTQLRAALASTTALVADRDLLYQENLALKAELGRQLATRAVLAGVLQHPPGAPYDTLLIDAGSEQGVATGDVVSAGGTTAIGEVSEVYVDTARVTLYSAPGQTYQALLLHGGGGQIVPVSMQGQGGGSMEGEVPAQTPVSVGDPVAFPGVAGGFAGSISEVEAKSGQSFETIYVELPVNLFSLQYVEVEI